ncbi:MAG: 4-alpha-glucanotransferase [Methanospirillaceae archaeon]|nr:4-alpha-glucanotransferase [Methanospirillaceae archaeon]
MITRGNGLLLHITSLPTRFGIGDLGPASDAFIQFLLDAGQRYWQILPIHPTDRRYDNSPYHALSAFANNPLLISPEQMVTDGFLDEPDLSPVPVFPQFQVDFDAVISYKERLFNRAYHRFRDRGSSQEFMRFCQKNAWWLDRYALFMVLRKRYAPSLWGDWPPELLDPDDIILENIRNKESDVFEKERFLQYLFSIQWNRVRDRCRDAGIFLIGDIPIYIDYDSADVWSHPGFFQLDNQYKPTVVAGVPPDYFSATGQVWNNPVYNWDMIQKDQFSWWVARIKHLLLQIDYLRIDHFRGLVGYWEIPAGFKTAIQGTWKEAPARDFLRTLARKIPSLPLIAEDLGIITPDVREIMQEFSIPGMAVLLFAFEEGMADNPYILHNVSKNRILYTGTHDNNPIQAWFATEASETEKKNLSLYFGRDLSADTIHMDLIRLAMMSRADTVILPVQDLLGLGEESRMNRPGIDIGNWCWRLAPDELHSGISDMLLNLTAIYGRI